VADLRKRLPKGKRLTSDQKHAERQHVALQIEKYNATFKLACLEYKAEIARAKELKAKGQKYAKQSPEAIAKRYNDTNPGL
jgi:hypothetical protein